LFRFGLLAYIYFQTAKVVDYSIITNLYGVQNLDIFEKIPFRQFVHI